MERKKTLLFITVLLLIICCVLCAVRAAGPSAPLVADPLLPALTSPSSASDVPAETPHRHSFDPKTGFCTVCGALCDHSAGFDEEHRCLVCGWQCLNQIHDPETALCPVCGEAFCHHFGMDGICDVCGAEAPLYFTELPDRYFEPCAHEGSCTRGVLSSADGTECEYAVWLPWNYSDEVKYNVVILLHGDGGQAADWTDEPEPTHRGDIEFRRVYDRMVEERLCDPFLIVGLSNRSFAQPSAGEALLRGTVLPWIAETYSTWMASGSEEDIRAARDHLAFGGLSRGSMFTYSCVMPRCLDLIGNFCCFSNGFNNRVSLQLNEEQNRSLPIRSYIASYGMWDEQETGSFHRLIYRSICNNVERVTDGGNARMLAIGAGHNFIMWTASLYDALLLMF